MIETLTIKGSDKYISKIIELLQTFPSNKIEILNKSKEIDKPKNAFGILEGKIKDPVQWQKDLREESDRDIYESFK